MCVQFVNFNVFAEAEDPPRGASVTERVAAAPVFQHPVRPPRRQRPRRVDTLTTMSQCVRSFEQGDEMLQVLRRIEEFTTRLAVAAERTAAAQEGILEQVCSTARDIGSHLDQERNCMKINCSIAKINLPQVPMPPPSTLAGLRSGAL
ncbi:uncharacterized protein LOC119454275 [Dermacentor silvarum]|uniref:uncharacterized protein LOC119454275 n=1 Tax=Dermacentor silvarum TaxID=543639 RepID=UPI00210122EA|nr:uncharacterized protein LOC119454275 [Dermacentor silvarum]